VDEAMRHLSEGSDAWASASLVAPGSRVRDAVEPRVPSTGTFGSAPRAQRSSVVLGTPISRAM